MHHTYTTQRRMCASRSIAQWGNSQYGRNACVCTLGIPGVIHTWTLAGGAVDEGRPSATCKRRLAAHIHSHLTLSTAHGATSLGATRHCSCVRVDRHAWLLPQGGCQCPTMELFLLRKPGTHTLAPPHTLTVTLRILCGPCGLWCLGVSVCVFRVFFLSLIRARALV